MDKLYSEQVQTDLIHENIQEIKKLLRFHLTKERNNNSK